MNVKSELNTARTLLNELGNALLELVNSAPEIFEDPALKSRLHDFYEAHQEATQRLAHPSLSIATIGTTSSGKSTIVNALMGRRIAPIEAGEMSGGILTLKHSEERKLIIKKTPEAVWETGELTDLSDEELYTKIQVVMHTYHEERKKKEYIAPHIVAYVPLLPASDLELSGLPEGIGIEFLDLPGLKSIQDRDNLAVIQPLVGKAFSLVALDYLQVDDQHRKKLLEELKKVVISLQGQTDSMIFILNRVDNRGSDDSPIEARLKDLKQEIKEVLELPELPDIIPFNARLLYYAQCAWGTTALSQDSKVSQETRLEHLKKMLNDCLQFINLKIRENNEPIDDPQTPNLTDNDLESMNARDLLVLLSQQSEKLVELTSAKDLSSLLANLQKPHNVKTWFNEVKDQIENDKPIDDPTMRKIVQYVLRWSGGEVLWNCLKTRVQESFAKLVLHPTLFGVFESYDALSEALNILIASRKISSQKEVEIQQEKIENIRKNLEKESKKIQEDFNGQIEEVMKSLKSHNPQSNIKVEKKAKTKGIQGISQIIDAVRDIEKDLQKSLILLRQDALNNNSGVYELKEELAKVISPALAEDVSRQYDHVSRRLTKFSSQSEDTMVKKVEVSDQSAMQELEHDERYVKLLYHTMRQAITARAEFTLQGQAKLFEKVLQFLVKSQVELLKTCLSRYGLSELNFEQAVITDLEKNLTENPPTLPEKFFDFSVAINTKQKTESKVVGQETKTETYTVTEQETYYYYEDKSCFQAPEKKTGTRPVRKTKTKNVNYDIKKDIEYQELCLPSPNLMAKQWTSGVETVRKELWNILEKWLIKYLERVSELFQESVIDITDLANRALEQQLKILEHNFEKEKEFWRKFELTKNEVNLVRQQLDQIFH
jgi:GTPase Era involved in 16S rRNA processing